MQITFPFESETRFAHSPALAIVTIREYAPIGSTLRTVLYAQSVGPKFASVYYLDTAILETRSLPLNPLIMQNLINFLRAD